MPTWLELDRQFQALAPDLRREDLQFRWGLEGNLHVNGTTAIVEASVGLASCRRSSISFCVWRLRMRSYSETFQHDLAASATLLDQGMRLLQMTRIDAGNAAGLGGDQRAVIHQCCYAAQQIVL